MRVEGVSPDGAKFYLSNGRAGTVAVFDSKSYDCGNDQGGNAPLGHCDFARREILFAANGPSNDVSVVDLLTNKVARVRGGHEPMGRRDRAGANRIERQARQLSTMNTCWDTMLRACKPSLNARARTIRRPGERDRLLVAQVQLLRAPYHPACSRISAPASAPVSETSTGWSKFPPAGEIAGGSSTAVPRACPRSIDAAGPRLPGRWFPARRRRHFDAPRPYSCA